MNDSIKELLDLGDWKVGMASWVFAGYSPLKKQKTGMIVRLADEVEIPFGTIEYRGAEERMNEIKNYLVARIKASRGIKEFDLSQRFDRNWMIGLALTPDNSEVFPNTIDVFWAKGACILHYLPSYVVPSALTFDEVMERGHFTWRKPSSDQIFAPRKYALGGFGVGSFDEAIGTVDPTGKVESEITPLFAPSGMHPKQQDDPEPKYELYPFFYDVIENLILDAPDKQTKIEGVSKHGTPLPTGAIARDTIIFLGNHKCSQDSDWKWRFYKSDHGSDLCWYHDPDYDSEHGSSRKHDFKASEADFTMSRDALNSRLREWFIKTPEGHQYDESEGNTKNKYFKSKSP
ncbi:hypothetical protein N9478_07260 [Gammaproteobacteria bacterium]|nr:hypothetical protein [Gammaproteobacteria bacterium]